MDQLPEDVLVATMQYLGVPDLLACRLLCKRLAAVALHREVWRHRHLSHLRANERHNYAAEAEPWQRAVLRLAPCLKRMDLLLPSAWRRNPLLAFTRCPVRELKLEVCEGGGGFAALMIRNQEALGRLRCLEVHWVSYEMPTADDIALLFGAVASTTRLEKLTVSGMCWPDQSMASHLVRALPRFMSAPTLKHFDCPPLDSSEALYNLVLAREAATLEVVDLGKGDWLEISTWTSTSPPMSLTLAGMPNLRKLTTCVLLGMEAVASCGSLREVVLTVRPTMKAALPAAEAFLSSATQLRSVTLHCDDVVLEPLSPSLPPSELSSLVRPLVLALAASRRSCVESLTIVSKCDGMPELLQSLPGALMSLPALGSLEVGWGNHWWQPTELPREFLMAISPATTPALRDLVLVLTPTRATYMGQCGHTWLHYDAVNTLLSSNPSLRLVVPGKSFYCQRLKCRDCARGCHATLRDHEGTEDELTAHAEGMCIPRHVPE